MMWVKVTDIDESHIVRHLHALSRKAPAGPQPDGGAHSGKDQQQA